MVEGRLRMATVLGSLVLKAESTRLCAALEQHPSRLSLHRQRAERRDRRRNAVSLRLMKHMPAYSSPRLAD